MDFNLVGVQTQRDADNLWHGLVGSSAHPSEVGCAGRGRKEHLREKLSDRHRRERLSASRRALCARWDFVSQTIAGLGSRELIIGVDRLDYSKGIARENGSLWTLCRQQPGSAGDASVYLQIAPTSPQRSPGVWGAEPGGEWNPGANKRLVGRAGLGADPIRHPVLILIL